MSWPFSLSLFTIYHYGISVVTLLFNHGFIPNRGHRHESHLAPLDLAEHQLFCLHGHSNSGGHLISEVGGGNPGTADARDADGRNPQDWPTQCFAGPLCVISLRAALHNIFCPLHVCPQTPPVPPLSNNSSCAVMRRSDLFVAHFTTVDIHTTYSFLSLTSLAASEHFTALRVKRSKAFCCSAPCSCSRSRWRRRGRRSSPTSCCRSCR